MFEKSYGGKGIECGALNMLGPESGTIRRYGFVGVGIALLEEVCYFRGGL